MYEAQQVRREPWCFLKAVWRLGSVKKSGRAETNFEFYPMFVPLWIGIIGGLVPALEWDFPSTPFHSRALGRP